VGLAVATAPRVAPDATSLRMLGASLLKDRALDEAGPVLARAITRDPNDWRSWYLEGRRRHLLGDDRGAADALATAVQEMVQSANLALSLCPLLTQGAIDAILAHASDDLKQRYLPKLVSGEWTGTMNLTEPQAGSDLSVVSARAERDGDAYRVFGTKIYITWGDHAMTGNVIHLVLARLPDAPPGVKGISLFLVPKYLVNDDGSIGARNDLFPVSVEHKLGIHQEGFFKVGGVSGQDAPGA
jgi:alkylation response protein AidB-like acyl-CoA dehydrogenase